MRTVPFLILALSLLVSLRGISQDRLVFNDEEVIECIVKEVTPEVIKYVKYSMPDGPLYTVKKQDVNSIVFENGEIELISPKLPSTATRIYRNEKWNDSPTYRSSWGFDLLAPAFLEIRTWFEIRNKKNKVGHTLTATGFWDGYSNIFYADDFIEGGTYYYSFGGGLTLGYMPKIYFIQHRIARPYFAPEANLGFQVSGITEGVFQATGRLGVAIHATPRFNIDFNFGGGGYVVFDGYRNYGAGNMRVGLSLGVNYGKGNTPNE